MTNKISKRLTMAERFVLLKNLPTTGDLVTFKILRKLRETLSPSEKEIQDYSFTNTFRCSNKEYDKDGKAFQCEVEINSAEQPKCHIHEVGMMPIGQVSWSVDEWDTTKEIWFGAKANQIIQDCLTRVSEEDKQVNSDIIASLCDKFLNTEDEEDD